MAIPLELKTLFCSIGQNTRGNKKVLGMVAEKYFERNRERLKENPAEQHPTGLCFNPDSFVKRGSVTFVFEGGGMKGYAHLGAYLALLKEGMLPKQSQFWFYGTSAGAIAAVACSLITNGKMTLEEVYNKFVFHPVYLISFYNIPFPFAYNPLNGRLIRWRIDNVLKKKGIKNLSELRVGVTSTLYDVQTKESTLAIFGPEPFADIPLKKVDKWRFANHLTIGEAVQCSCAIPGLFTAGVISNAQLSVVAPIPPYSSRIPFGKKVFVEPGPPAMIKNYSLKGVGLLTDGGTKANLPTIVALSSPKYRKESDIIYAINIEIKKNETRLKGLLDKLRYANPKTRIVRFLKNIIDAAIQKLYLLRIRNNLISTMKNTINSMMDEIAERGNVLSMHGNIIQFDIKIPDIPLWRPDKAWELVLEGYNQVEEQIKQLKELADVNVI